MTPPEISGMVTLSFRRGRGMISTRVAVTAPSDAGSQVFRFPNGFVLAPGATVRVTSGSSSYSDPPAVLQWLNADGTPRKSNVWNDQGDPAILKDAEGNVVSRFP